MKIETTGILIDLRPLNERDSLAHVFTRDNGVLVGMMRGAVVARKNKPLVGQIGNVVWNARVESQLGVFHWESARNMAAALMTSNMRLAMMNAAFGLLRVLLPEREMYNALYDATIEMMTDIMSPDAVEKYMRWEINLLQYLGYALDLHACAGCGTHDDLTFLSPRTWRAVCASCGAPYSMRLYRLPLSVGLLGQLLDQVCVAQGTELPFARRILGNAIL